MEHIIDLVCQVFRVQNAMLTLFGDNRAYIRCASLKSITTVRWPVRCSCTPALQANTPAGRVSCRTCAEKLLHKDNRPLNCYTRGTCLPTVSCARRRNSRGFQKGDSPWRWSLVSRCTHCCSLSGPPITAFSTVHQCRSVCDAN